MNSLKKIKENILFVALFFLMFTYVFQSNGVMKEMKIDSLLINSLTTIRYISVAVLFIGILIDFVSEKNKIVYILFIIILAIYIYISYINSYYYIYEFEENQLITYFVAVVAFKNVNYKLILYYLSLCLIFLLAVKFNVFLFTNETLEFQYNMDRVRFLFYDLTNTIPYIFMYIVFAYIYVRNINMNSFEYILLMALNGVMYYIFVCRTVCIIILFVMFMSIVIKYNCNLIITLLCNRLIIILPLAISLVSILLVVLYDDNTVFFRELNYILNYRLQFSQNALFDRGVSLFGNSYLLLGNNISTAGKLSVWSDLSFLRYLLKYGILAYSILMLYLTYFAYLIYVKKDVYMSIVFIFMMFFTAFNSDFFCINYNFFLFVLSYKDFSIDSYNGLKFKHSNVRKEIEVI